MERGAHVRRGAPDATARLLVVDDHEMVLAGICQLIEREPGLEVVASCTSSAEVVREIQTRALDLVLLDLALGDDGGLELIRRLHRLRPEVPILIMSMFEEDVFAERALRAGAAGYVMKDEPPEVLIRAIETGLEGGVHLSAHLRERAVQRVAGRGDGDGLTLRDLTDREIEVFRLIGEGMSTREIADRLGLSTKTIETHRAKIMRKLDLSNSFQLVHRAILWLQEVAGGF